MARLHALPSLDVIHGLKGILDFYLWKGLPCVRSWPRMTKAQQTEATKDAAALFGEISAAYSTLAPLELAALQEQAADQPRTARDIYISGVYGHLHTRTEAPAPPPEEEMYDAYVCLRDKKVNNTSGGTFTSGAWQTRDLTEEQADPEGICTLDANQFVLAAGTYRCLISCPAYRVNSHQALLRNITTPATLLEGSSSRSHNSYYTATRSVIVGRFTIEADQTLEIWHRCSTTFAGEGFGWPCNFAPEIYTVAEFWREIPPP